MDNGQIDDWTLLSLAKSASKREAYCSAKELVARLRPKAYAVAYRLLQDKALAEDTVQESLLRLWRSSPIDNGSAKLFTYFQRIVINESMRILSQRGCELTIEQESLYQLADRQQFENQDFSLKNDELDSPSQTAALEHALSKLSARQRAAIVLWAYGDWTIKEIAGQLMIEENAAHQLLYRAKQSVRRILGVTE